MARYGMDYRGGMGRGMGYDSGYRARGGWNRGYEGRGTYGNRWDRGDYGEEDWGGYGGRAGGYAGRGAYRGYGADYGMRRGGYPGRDRDLGDRVREGWQDLKRNARQWMGGRRGYDRGW